MSNQYALFVWDVTRYGADKSMIDFNVRRNGNDFTSVFGYNIQDMEKGEQHAEEIAGDVYVEGLNGLWKDRDKPLTGWVKIYRTRKRGDYRVNIHVERMSFRSYAMGRSSTLFELYVPIVDDDVLEAVQ